MVVHQRVCEHAPLVRNAHAQQETEEGDSQFLVEDPLLVVPTRDDVVVRSGLLMARFARHYEETVRMKESSARVRSNVVALLSHFCSGAWHGTWPRWPVGAARFAG